jgi:hypothetical protein
MGAANRWDSSLRAGLCAQGGKLPELAQRVTDSLVLIHRGTAPRASS